MEVDSQSLQTINENEFVNTSISDDEEEEKPFLGFDDLEIDVKLPAFYQNLLIQPEDLKNFSLISPDDSLNDDQVKSEDIIDIKENLPIVPSIRNLFPDLTDGSFHRVKSEEIIDVQKNLDVEDFVFVSTDDGSLDEIEVGSEYIADIKQGVDAGQGSVRVTSECDPISTVLDTLLTESDIENYVPDLTSGFLKTEVKVEGVTDEKEQLLKEPVLENLVPDSIDGSLHDFEEISEDITDIKEQLLKESVLENLVPDSIDGSLHDFEEISEDITDIKENLLREPVPTNLVPDSTDNRLIKVEENSEENTAIKEEINAFNKSVEDHVGVHSSELVPYIKSERCDSRELEPCLKRENSDSRELVRCIKGETSDSCNHRNTQERTRKYTKKVKLSFTAKEQKKINSCIYTGRRTSPFFRNSNCNLPQFDGSKNLSGGKVKNIEFKKRLLTLYTKSWLYSNNFSHTHIMAKKGTFCRRKMSLIKHPKRKISPNKSQTKKVCNEAKFTSNSDFSRSKETLKEDNLTTNNESLQREKKANVTSNRDLSQTKMIVKNAKYISNNDLSQRQKKANFTSNGELSKRKKSNFTPSNDLSSNNGDESDSNSSTNFDFHIAESNSNAIIKQSNKEKGLDSVHVDCGFRTELDPELNKGQYEGKYGEPYSCNLCKYTCTKETDLKYHVNNEHPIYSLEESDRIVEKLISNNMFSRNCASKSFSCTKCNFKTAHYSSLQRHIERQHDRAPNISCPQCDFKCLTQVKLNNHMLAHSGQSFYQCSHCDYKHRLQVYIKRHMACHFDKAVQSKYEEHVKRRYNSLTGSVGYEPKIDNPALNSIGSIKQPAAVNNLKYPVICLKRCDDKNGKEMCKEIVMNSNKLAAELLLKEFNYLGTVDEYQESEMPLELGDTKTALNESQLSNKIIYYRSLTTAKNHRIVSSVLPVVQKCEISPLEISVQHVISYKKGNQMKSELYNGSPSPKKMKVGKQSKTTEINEERIYKCSICTYSSVVVGDFEEHQRRHIGEPLFSCNLCGKSCDSQLSLTKHKVLEHSVMKEFKCKFCDFTCGNEQHFIIHIKSHNDAQPFACKKCDYVCKTSVSLRKHMIRHDKIKSFACDWCDYRCSNKYLLDAHTFIHTGITKHVCKICDQKCPTKHRLQLHMKCHGIT